ncbi:ECF subfamily RNA polymerase sigma-24 subunit [Seminavis robusta]|uniref:Circumsporozoite protein n=1 Tax=Seminavis robusta TaxID=568900 RepID=A0A9N8EFR5_9STRA|nr:ECF subfamily RNA polymerase sigma-24 subunit [Seminavis robusta]|eukprot:Sro1058_g236390.1 ECF subfamily RNA polymerase sigma-24 subunit (1990) ;mRNA; f:16690-23947
MPTDSTPSPVAAGAPTRSPTVDGPTTSSPVAVGAPTRMPTDSTPSPVAAATNPFANSRWPHYKQPCCWESLQDANRFSPSPVAGAPPVRQQSMAPLQAALLLGTPTRCQQILTKPCSSRRTNPFANSRWPTTSSPVAVGAPTRMPTDSTPSPVAAGAPTRSPTVDGPTTSSPVAVGAPTRMPTDSTPSPVAAGAPTRSPTVDGPTTSSPVAAGAPTRMPTDSTPSPVVAGAPTRSPTVDGPTTSSPVAAGAPTRKPVDIGVPTRTPTEETEPTDTPSGVPTIDPLSGCSPVVSCSLVFSNNDGVLVCLELGDSLVEACLPVSWIQESLLLGSCGPCPTEAPSSQPTESPPIATVLPTDYPMSLEPTELPTNPVPSTLPSQSPSDREDLCGDDPVIPCGEDAIYFCLTDLEFEDLFGDKTVCLPLDLLPTAVDKGVGYCGECPPGPTLGPTIDPLTGCDPVIPCEGFLGSMFSGVEFCLQFPGEQATICLPIRLVEPSLEYGECGTCDNLSSAPTTAFTSSPTMFPSLEECEDIVPCDDGKIIYCIQLDSGAVEVCLSISLAPEIVPTFGTCGRCPEETPSPTGSPTVSPTFNPTGLPSTSPSNIPSMTPTGALDGCIVEPPACEIETPRQVGLSDNSTIGEGDRVTFCFVFFNDRQVELCVLVENVKDLLDQGYCGPCVEPPSIAPTESPTAGPTSSAPTSLPSGQPSGLQPSTSAPTNIPTANPTTLAPSSFPSGDPLAGCEPFVPCGDNGVVFCLQGEEERDNIEICLPIDFVQDALGLGFCGVCPSLTPSSVPTFSPTTTPTQAPTGFLDGCVIEPPVCVLDPDDGEDRVSFCLVIGNSQIELCVRVENVQDLLERGYCGPCIQPPSVPPTELPSVDPTTSVPTSLPSMQPTGIQPSTTAPTVLPSATPTTLSPSVAPSSDPLLGCEPVVPCAIGSVTFCLRTELGTGYLEICLPIEFVQELLEQGSCGECPSPAPSVLPTGAPTTLLPTSLPSVTPTLIPTIAPTGPLDDCDVMPSNCTVPGDDSDRVTFCLTINDVQTELCVLVEDVLELLTLGLGYCGPCIEPPSPAPTFLPSSVPSEPTTNAPTLVPSPRPTGSEPSTDSPTVSPTLLPTTASPSFTPTIDPLDGCAVVVPCNNETGVVFCFEGMIVSRNVEVCLPIELVQGALEFGFCGECPSPSPSSPPTGLPTEMPTTLTPTIQPTQIPTTLVPSFSPTLAPTIDPLEICEEEPPPCTLDPDDGEDRVTFCVQFGGQQEEVCVFVGNVDDLLAIGAGYCGRCIEPPSPLPTLVPSLMPTPKPNSILPPLPSLAPASELPTSSPVETPSSSPTIDPLTGCSPVILCNDNGVENGVVMCLIGPAQQIEICILIELVQEALEAGFCGECPTTAPTGTPTAEPTTLEPTTLAPSFSPTLAPTIDPLENCEEEPPPCTLDPDDGEDRVAFCVQFGGQQEELCVLVGNVDDLLAIGAGYCGPCIEPPSPLPTLVPSLLPTTSPNSILPPLPSLAPASELPTSSPVETPSSFPTIDPLTGCSPVIPCSDDGVENGVVMCLIDPVRQIEICMPIEIVQEALEAGFCGECPTTAPTSTPTALPTTGSPTALPTAVPTTLPTIDPLTGCTPVIDCTPSNVLYDDGVIFCLEDYLPSGQDLEVCLPVEFVQDGLDQGFCGMCPTEIPSISPTGGPTIGPTMAPVTLFPSALPSGSPTTNAPTTLEPTAMAPVTLFPSSLPSVSPTTLEPTASPTIVPTAAPTVDPLEGCGDDPIEPCTDDGVTNGIIFCFEPSIVDFEAICVPVSFVPILLEAGLGECGPCPTFPPSPSPSQDPTGLPSVLPTGMPSNAPTTAAPTTNAPSASPSAAPTTAEPTASPTTATPTKSPSVNPTSMPTISPTDAPTINPTYAPTPGPSTFPTNEPTTSPTNAPTPARLLSHLQSNDKSDKCSNSWPVYVSHKRTNNARAINPRANNTIPNSGHWRTNKNAISFSDETPNRDPY